MKLRLLVIVLILINLFGCSKTNISTEEIIEENISIFLKAVENNEVDTMVKYADDLRFPDKKEQKNEYISINQKIKKTSVKDLKQLNDKEYSVTITCEVEGKADEFTFPIKYENKDWRIIVGQEHFHDLPRIHDVK